LQENLFDNSCRESHNFVLDTLQDFIEKYDKKPKVSLSWMTNIAHDNANGLYHADAHFRDFFVKMRSKVSYFGIRLKFKSVYFKQIKLNLKVNLI
jgi:hypothetical protein